MTKAQDDRRTNFCKVSNPTWSMRSALTRFVRGYRGPRENPVTTSQIRKHFAATEWHFVNEAILDMLADGTLDCLKNGIGDRAATVYVIPETEADKDLRVTKTIVRACP